MAGKVTIGAFVSIDGTDRSAQAQGVEPGYEQEIQEWRPFTQDTVAKEVGLKNNSIVVNFVDDELATLAQYFIGAAGTKVPLVWRYKSTAKGADNPEFTQTVIVPPTIPPATQGDLLAFSVTFEIDGNVTIDATP